MNIQEIIIYDPYEVISENLKDSDEAWQDFGFKISKMPMSLRNILFDASTIEFFMELSDKYRLTSNQSRSLSEIVGKILLSDIFIGDIVDVVISKLGIDQNIATDISSKIITELFAPAIEDIKKIQREKFPNRISSQNPPARPVISPRQNTALHSDINENNIVDLRNK